MADETPEMIFWRTEHSVLSLHDLADAAGLRVELVKTFVEYGLIEPATPKGYSLLFSVSAVDRLRRIMRLRRDLGVNLAGAAVILDMRERIENLRKELEDLRQRLGVEE